MDWLQSGAQLQNTGSQLGMQVGSTYRVQDTCLETLSELLGKLASEDRTLRTFRRALGFSQIIQKDLVPLLIHEKDDLKIMDAVVRLLVNLTIPVECLLPMEIMARSDAGRHTIFELNSLLAAAKEAFIEPRSTRSILQFMKKLLESEERLSLEQCEGINNCLLLVRNILHIPEPWPLACQNSNNSAQVNATTTAAAVAAAVTATTSSKQNVILWNLFAQGVDKVLIHLMTCPQKSFWSITMVQLIALTYKDQHVGTLQKLLNLWFEASLSESSEDNESNTSPPEQGSGDSSPMLTSDPTSDSSDNSSGRTNKSGTSSDNNGAAKHAQRSHSSEHAKSNTKKIECTSSRGKRRKAQTSKFVEMARKTQPTGQCANSGARSKNMPGCNGKTQQHKKERQYPHQDQQFGEQEQPKTITNEMAEHATTNTDFIKNVCSSPPESPASAAHILSVSSPAPSSSGVSSASKDSSSSGTCPHACSVTGSHKNGGKRVCGHCSSELSDCGYGTQAENQESVSTSSNEDELPQNGTSRGMKPVHQKPHGTNKLHNRPQKLLMSHQEKQDWRRKKLVKRSRTNILNIKALMHHTPTDEDISHLLKEFTVDFLLKGYGPLVQELHAQMLSELGTPVDTSHFFWLVTYFLKFAAQLDLELDCISPVLSYKVVSYLTFEGVNLCEQLQIALLQQETDLKPSLRRLHLVVTAIREFIQALDTYKKSSHLSPEDKDLLLHLQHQMSGTSDLRNLFVLLLRHYNPGFQSKQYLQDLICTNHILLLSMEQDCAGAFDIMEHIKQFATAEMMQQYGRLLESFRDNGQFINDCVFTMMHHISGDLNLVSALFQPGILKTFSLIWEEDFEVCDDWSDLIEYVIHKFVNTPRRGHPMLPLVTGAVSPDEIIIPQIVTPPTCTLESNTCRWTKEECDTLYWYHEQGAQSSDPVGTILRLYAENSSTCKTRVGIIEQLYTQDIVTHAQYLELLKKETVGLKSTLSSDTEESGGSGASTPTVIAGPTSRSPRLATQTNEHPDDIASLIGNISIGLNSAAQCMYNVAPIAALLLAENHGPQLHWLQMLLLESCFIKLHYCDLQVTAEHTMEPVPYHYIMMRQSIPLVPWNLEQSTVLTYPPFVLLLHKLGIHLPADVGKVFPRIPHFWTAEALFATAQKLGNVQPESLKFDVNELQQLKEASQEMMSPADVVSFGVLDINDPDGTMSGDNLQLSPRHSFSVPHNPATLSTIRFAPMPQGTTTWIQLMNKPKQTQRVTSPVQDLHSNMSKMSISDEDSSAQASAGEETPAGQQGV